MYFIHLIERYNECNDCYTIVGGNTTQNVIILNRINKLLKKNYEDIHLLGFNFKFLASTNKNIKFSNIKATLDCVNRYINLGNRRP